MTKVSLYLSKIQTRFRRPTRAISLTLWKHLFPSTPPYAIPSPSLSLPGIVFPLPAFVFRSVSLHSSPLVAPPHLSESCLNAQTKRQIKGTAGSACTATRVKVEREKKRERGGETEIDNVYYYHRGPPSLVVVTRRCSSSASSITSRSRD